MTALEQQLSQLAEQLERLHDSIDVDDDVTGVTLEQHSPGNGSTYTRLRAKRGRKLANGKRTMSLSSQEAEIWQQKIDARNQKAKVAQCLLILQQATEVAGAITLDFGEQTSLVKGKKEFTKSRIEDVERGRKASKPIVITQVKTKQGSLVHAVVGAMPAAGPWHVPALCGAKPPKRDYYGWEIPEEGELTCSRCYRKLPDNYERHFPQL